jgi:hypothetical protein
MLKNFSRKDAINGKSELIDCSCVFNDDLTLIFIENFGLITLNREDLLVSYKNTFIIFLITFRD